MMEKIEWYQEVLEIEPSSKVFFPLAKLLLGNKQTQEAIAVLRQGLDRHPEFFEARLMLIDLLQQERDAAGASSEVGVLGAKLALYPGFWDAWAQSVSSSGADKDMAAALRLLAAFLRYSDLSWADVINSGLAALAGNQIQAAPAPLAPATSEQPAAPMDAPAESDSFTDAAAAQDISQISATPLPGDLPASAPDDLIEDLPGGLPETADLSADIPPAAALPAQTPEEGAVETAVEEEGDEEQFSLRTRTMAAVLAEQGDYAGAKDIYEEILAATDDLALRADLEGRIADLAGKIKAGHAPLPPDTADEASDQSKNKLIQVLERLAGRLETRADKA